jgi:hypothetical protein
VKSSEYPIPQHMQHLPRDGRGYPITYSSLHLPDGRIDFTTSDPYKWTRAAHGRFCALCGRPLDHEKWFIGGPKCMLFRIFFDLAMHEDCARYSFKVCPYLAMPKYLGAKSRPTPDWARVDIVSSDKDKPAIFGLAVTTGYDLVMFQGDLLVQAHGWLRPVEWHKDGQPVVNDDRLIEAQRLIDEAHALTNPLNLLEST